MQHVEGSFLLDIREAHRRGEEELERHLVPLSRSLYAEVHATPTAQPLTLVDADVGLIRIILSAKESAESNRVADDEFWTVFVERPTVLLGSDIGLSRAEGNFCAPLGGAQLDVFHIIVDMNKVQAACHFVALELEVGVEVQAIIRLPSERKALHVGLIQHVDGLGLETDDLLPPRILFALAHHFRYAS